MINIIINNYDLTFADSAIEELEQIYEYIFNKFKSNQLAKSIVSKIEYNISKLQKFPYSCVEVCISPHKEVYRKLLIFNYIVFYKIYEEHKEVIIYHIFHCRKNYLI